MDSLTFTASGSFFLCVKNIQCSVPPPPNPYKNDTEKYLILLTLLIAIPSKSLFQGSFSLDYNSLKHSEMNKESQHTDLADFWNPGSCLLWHYSFLSSYLTPLLLLYVRTVHRHHRIDFPVPYPLKLQHLMKILTKLYCIQDLNIARRKYVTFRTSSTLNSLP